PQRDSKSPYPSHTPVAAPLLFLGTPQHNRALRPLPIEPDLEFVAAQLAGELLRLTAQGRRERDGVLRDLAIGQWRALLTTRERAGQHGAFDRRGQGARIAAGRLPVPLPVQPVLCAADDREQEGEDATQNDAS